MTTNDALAAEAAITASVLDTGGQVTTADQTAGADLTNATLAGVTVDTVFQSCKALIANLPDQSSVNQVMVALRNVFGG